MKIRKLTLLSLLTALSLGLFALELLIPPFPLCPAAKIGLANTVTLFMLTRRRLFTKTDCVMVLTARCLLSALVTGRLSAIAFSLCGGLAALLIMALTRFFTGNTVIVSVMGAVSHNLAQIAVSLIFYGVFGVLYTLPAMLTAGTLCGALTGACVALINKNKALSRFLSSYDERAAEVNENGKSKDRQDKLPREEVEGGGSQR